MKRILLFALLFSLPTFAAAQTTTQSTTSKLSESQIKSQLEKEGYTNINLKRNLSSKTMKQYPWIGTATKDGKKVNIEISPSGQVE